MVVKALLIEDNPLDARTIQRQLEESSSGFYLSLASSLSEAFGQLASDEVDVILLDLSLPDSTGIDTFLKVQARVPSVPVVVLTGFDDEDMAIGAVQKGAQDYLVKGQVDQNLLTRAVRYAIERKRLGTELRDLNVELERRVQERTRELELANRELEAFSYTASHNLRSPLRAMDGLSFVLLEDYGERLDEKGREYLQRVREACQRMGELIDAMLSLARVTRWEICPEDVDLSALARSIASELSRDDPDRCVQFRIGDGVTARGDAQLLRVALENLLSNAWKFTAKEPHAQVEFTCKRSDGKTTYCMSDNGVGFDPAHASKLFQPFQRLHGTNEFDGTGIGLATVERIIRRHGGRVWASGAVGKGAAFYFTV